MKIWLVRAGAHGEQEDLALQEGLAVVGWDEVPDLSQAQSRDKILEILREVRPETNPRAY